jgi:hypothetical protein
LILSWYSQDLFKMITIFNGMKLMLRSFNYGEK